MAVAASDVIERDAFYIGGEWAKPTSDSRIEVINPTTEELCGSVPEGAEGDIDRAVVAARRAFDGSGWRDLEPAERATYINRLADAIEKRSDEVARTVTLQNGMPIALAEQFEAGYSVALLRYYAGLADDLVLEERRRSPLGFDSLVRREPIGVAGAIVPWNYPVVLTILKLGPALLTGCTVVVKPPPETPLDCYLLAEAADEAGIPPGVLNWVPGGRELGAYLVSHPQVDKIAFTGSTVAGRNIGEACGRLLRPCTLELGGKSASIVLDDADMGAFVEGLGFASFANNGQTCAICTRILAPDSRFDEVVSAVSDYASGMKIGDPLDPETDLGPLTSDRQLQRVVGYIEKGRAEGQKLVTGGGTVDRTGFYVEPTVFADVDNQATIAREEIFGPVMSVSRYRDDDEAIAIANDSEYGLGGTVWSTDDARATDIARRIVSGTIGINGYVLDLNAPFGGVKGSGIGREYGPEALPAYQQLKTIYMPAAG
jgi:acyl-CoA reductase-like NAD-dependent aldehyde dehydrogenase